MYRVPPHSSCGPSEGCLHLLHPLILHVALVSRVSWFPSSRGVCARSDMDQLSGFPVNTRHRVSGYCERDLEKQSQILKGRFRVSSAPNFSVPRPPPLGIHRKLMKFISVPRFLCFANDSWSDNGAELPAWGLPALGFGKCYVEEQWRLPSLDYL